MNVAVICLKVYIIRVLSPIYSVGRKTKWCKSPERERTAVLFSVAIIRMSYSFMWIGKCLHLTTLRLSDNKMLFCCVISRYFGTLFVYVQVMTFMTDNMKLLRNTILFWSILGQFRCLSTVLLSWRNFVNEIVYNEFSNKTHSRNREQFTVNMISQYISRRYPSLGAKCHMVRNICS